MLAVSSYKADYVEACRSAATAQLKAFRKLMKDALAAAAAFARGYLATQVPALDHLLLHRQRSIEGKAGGPLNELRMLCDSIKENGGVMAANATIKYDAGKSVMGIAVGEGIALDDKAYERLSGAVFNEIEARYR